LREGRQGQFSYSNETTSRGRQCGVMRSAAWLVQKAIRIGPQCGAWADASLADRGVEAIRPLYGFLALARSYTASRMEHACSVALADSRFHLKDIKALLEAPQAEQEMLPFLETHPLIRDITEYGQFLQALYGGRIGRRSRRSSGKARVWPWRTASASRALSAISRALSYRAAVR
jgi:hypothetical protein